MSERTDILQLLPEVVPTHVVTALADERLDTCVLSTRVGYDACRHFGIDAKPICVRAFAFNELWHETAQTLTGVEGTDPRWEAAFEAGAHSVGIDETDHGKPGRYAGHVVLLCPDDDLLLDLSLGQFSRPEKSMTFPSAVGFTIDAEAFLAGEPMVYSQDGAWIAYRHRPDGPDFRRGADWRRKQPISGSVIRAVRDATTARVAC